MPERRVKGGFSGHGTHTGHGPGGMPTVGDLLPGNPAFELLHLRSHSGRNAGEFIDMQGRLTALGGEWDASKKVWMVPKARRGEVDALLKEAGVVGVNVPEGMRPASDQDRLKAKVPPAWTDVMVAAGDRAKYTVIAKDAKGRPQYRRADWFARQQDLAKFERIRQLDSKLPDLDAHLSREAPHDDHAASLMLMRRMGLRPGSNADTKADVQAYGATTLERRHVNVTGSTVHLKFTGKDGVALNLKHDDPELAKVLKRRLTGKNGNDRIFATNATRTNRLLENLAPGHTNKDLRTHLGTTIATRLVANMEPPASEKEYKRLRNQVGDTVASVLGNKRKQALDSYIDPTVFDAWDADAPASHPGTKAGRVVKEMDLDGPPPHQAVGQELERLRGSGANFDQAKANRERFRAESPVHEAVAHVVEHWTGGGIDLAIGNASQQIRDEIKQGGHQDALRAIASGPHTSRLFRGIRAWDADSEERMLNVQPGDEVSLEGISSFTESENHARYFGDSAGGTSMLLEVVDGRGLPVAGISNTPGEQEWLMTGKLRVVEEVGRKIGVPSDPEDLADTSIHVKVRWDPGDGSVPDLPDDPTPEQINPPEPDYPDFQDTPRIRGLSDVALRAMIQSLERKQGSDSEAAALLETLWEEEDRRNA